MAKDILPAVDNKEGVRSVDEDLNIGNANCVFKLTGKDEYSISPRPTFTIETDEDFADATTSTGRGVTTFAGYNIVITDKYYRVVGSGDIQVTATFDPYLVSFTNYNSGGTDYVVINTKTEYLSNPGLWYTDDPSFSLTQVTSANVPALLSRGAVSLNGYLFVVSPNGTIYNSNLDDITTWDASDIIVVEREADLSLYIGKHKDHVVVFGSRSIEFFYDAGLAPNSPLARRQDIYHNIRCKSSDSFVELGDITYFIAEDFKGESGIYKLENFQITKMSKPSMDRVFKAIEASTYTFLALVNTEDSGEYLIVTASGIQTYAMHIDTGLWSAWSLGGDPTWKSPYSLETWAENKLPIVFGDPISNRVILSNSTVAAPSTSTFLDDLGLTSASAKFYSTPWDKATNERKKVKAIRVIHYPTSDSDDPNKTVDVSWIDTDREYSAGVSDASFTNVRTININKNTARIYRCGITRQRIFKVLFNAYATIKGLEIDYEQLRG